VCVHDGLTDDGLQLKGEVRFGCRLLAERFNLRGELGIERRTTL
jgi:hypothetical protein